MLGRFLASGKPLRRSLPFHCPHFLTTVSYQAIYTLVTAPTRSPLSTLQETFLIVMTNVSPYIKSLTVTTSNKLLSLFSSFASPAFLVASEGNHKMCFYLLEVFNNVLGYQVAGGFLLFSRSPYLHGY